MKPAATLGALFIGWQVLGTQVPQLSGGLVGFIFGCVGVLLAFLLLRK